MHDFIRSGEYLNIAAIKTKTKALGPGMRAGIWFQGCPFDCAGCISPAWIEKKEAYLIKPEVLTETILMDPQIKGVTISGGEPFYQPLGLNSLLKILSSKRPDFTLIIFTGFVIEQLRKMSGLNNIDETLSMIDVLIDGPYIPTLNNNIGLRGSTNQRIHRLTGRLADSNFEEMPRINEIYLDNGTFQLSGVPDTRLGGLISNQRIVKKEDQYVRT